VAPQSMPVEAFPALYRSADELSTTGQRAHLGANRWLLLLLMAGSFVAAVSPAAELFRTASAVDDGLAAPIQKLLAGTAVAVTALSLWLSAALRGAKHAEAWHDGRALAESVKSITWKYMMKAEPYGPALSAQEADEVFCDDLRKLLEEARTRALPNAGAAGEQISSQMREVRSHDIPSKLALYLDARIKDQRDWYSSRSTSHSASASRWSATAIGANALALICGIASISWVSANAAMGIAATAASCCVAWTQLQRSADLAHAYACTSHEIGLLAPRASRVVSADQLARFVGDCEAAFSREHTMWRARRKIADG